MSEPDFDQDEVDDIEEAFGTKPSYTFDDEEDDDDLEVPGSFKPMVFDVSQRRVRDLVADYHNKELDPRPPFQRGYVWDRTKASRLIESVLLNVPLPLIYTAEEDNGLEVVIDGQQRLLTLFHFIDGTFPRDGRPFRLTKLKIMKDLNKKKFVDLDENYRRKIQRYNIQIIKISAQSDADVKFEIFERLNSGAVSLNAQELRNCIYRGRFNDLLRELSQHDSFRKAIKSESALDRMKDAELVLRFLAFYERTYLNYPGGVKSFLNEFMNDFRNLTDDKVKKFSEAFKKAADLSFTVFGEQAYRRFSIGNDKDKNGHWEKTVNRALYDIVMWGFTQYEKSQVVGKADAIRDALISLTIQDEEFRAAITAATGDKYRAIYRFDKWRETLAAVVGTGDVGARLFTAEVKRNLFMSSQQCAICSQTIHTIDDAEVDHVTPFSKGGTTDIQNAQLVHRYCNRSKGAKAVQ